MPEQSLPSPRTVAETIAHRVRPNWLTRFAPAPTGFLHLGHAVNAVYVWGLARAAGGRVALRIEDHDPGRARPEFERAIIDDLEWLGLEPSAPVDGASPMIVRQSERGTVYERALAVVASAVRVFPCTCTRRDIATVSGDAWGTESVYPGTCRARVIGIEDTPARRVLIEPGAETFVDAILGLQQQEPSIQSGDVLVRDRRGHWTYQFCAAADDTEQGIDVVIRGEDLLASTGRQVRIARFLGRETPPVFAHHPLIVHPDGAKLSKSRGDTGISELRAGGWTPARVLGAAAHAAGLQREPRALSAADLGDLFAT